MRSSQVDTANRIPNMLAMETVRPQEDSGTSKSEDQSILSKIDMLRCRTWSSEDQVATDTLLRDFVPLFAKKQSWPR